MVRSSLVFALLVLALVVPAVAGSYESRDYVPYDGWTRGGDSYHGFVYRDPGLVGTDARRPDFTQWSGFDKSTLRLKYPVYRDPAHPVHRVDMPAGTCYVQPVRTDIQLYASGVPRIEELCCKRHCRHHRRCHVPADCSVACLTLPRAGQPEKYEAAVDKSCVEGD